MFSLTMSATIIGPQRAAWRSEACLCLRLDDKATLQIRGQVVHMAGADDGMLFEFHGQRFSRRRRAVAGGSALPPLGRRYTRRR
jgi:hypothetical protein